MQIDKICARKTKLLVLTKEKILYSGGFDRNIGLGEEEIYIPFLIPVPFDEKIDIE